VPRLLPNQAPSYRLHKKSGQAIVTFNGRDVLLGVYGSYHKTLHHGHTREIFLGPQAQRLIGPFIAPNLQAHLFRPTAAVDERRQRKHERRKTPDVAIFLIPVAVPSVTQSSSFW
jgi:hypothetical protein